jgi:hypothetical protein
MQFEALGIFKKAILLIWISVDFIYWNPADVKC